MHPWGARGRDKRRPSPLEGFHGSREKDHSTELRIISERVVVEGVILTCRTPLLRRWEITRREKEERRPNRVEARWQMKRDNSTGRWTSGNETTRGPLGGGWQRVKDRPGVGEDQTSRRATGWSLPALLRVSSFSSAAAYQESASLSWFLSFSPSSASLLLCPQPDSRLPSFSRLYYSYFHAHVLRLCGSTIYVLADLPCACYHTAGPATDRDASRNCSTESCIADWPTCRFGIG